MNNKEINSAFSKIIVPKKVENNILSKTINNKKESIKRFNLSYICLAGFVFCFLSVTVIYAKEIKNFVEKWSVTMHLTDGNDIKISENNNYKYIPTSALKVQLGESKPQMKYEQVETMLAIRLLKINSNNEGEIYYDTGLNKDGRIGRIDLWIPHFIDTNADKSISATISMLNNNADASYVLAFQEGLDASADKKIESQYKSTNLKTDVTIYSVDWDQKRTVVTFVYDNILYNFLGCNYSVEDMKQFIEKLV